VWLVYFSCEVICVLHDGFILVVNKNYFYCSECCAGFFCNCSVRRSWRKLVGLVGYLSLLEFCVECSVAITQQKAT
jgi:hypothetical protein